MGFNNIPALMEKISKFLMAFSHNSSYLAVVGNSRYLQVHGGLI